MDYPEGGRVSYPSQKEFKQNPAHLDVSFRQARRNEGGWVRAIPNGQLANVRKMDYPHRIRTRSATSFMHGTNLAPSLIRTSALGPICSHMHLISAVYLKGMWK